MKIEKIISKSVNDLTCVCTSVSFADMRKKIMDIMTIIFIQKLYLVPFVRSAVKIALAQISVFKEI